MSSPTDYVSGCAILVPRALWRELDGFDEIYAPGYCEDSDLAFRIRAAGQTAYYCPFSVVVHLEGASHGTDVRSGVKAYQVANTKKFFERWRETLAAQNYAPASEIIRARDRSRDRKVALIVDHYVPQPDQDAGSRTMMAMVEALLDSGYVVKFWPDDMIYSPEYTPLLQGMGVETFYGHYYSFHDWIRVNGEAIALALLSRPGVAPRYIPALRVHSKAMIAYYGHDLHFRRMGMEAEANSDADLAVEAAAMEAQERAIWRQVDVVLYPSDEEATVARQETARATAIVPYAYERSATPASRRSIAKSSSWLGSVIRQTPMRPCGWSRIFFKEFSKRSQTHSWRSSDPTRPLQCGRSPASGSKSPGE